MMTPVKVDEALASLATLRLYEEQQEDGSREVVRLSTGSSERSEGVRPLIVPRELSIASSKPAKVLEALSEMLL